MAEPELTVICDAGPIIHLDELGCIELLADHARVLVPDAVWKEAERHRPGFARTTAVPWERLTPIREPSPMIESLTRTMGLHAGKAEALQVALDNRDGLLVTDDAAARLAATCLGLRVHGTVGLLVRSIRRGINSTDEVLKLLRAIPTRSSLHLNKTLLDEVIARVQGEGRR